MKLQLDSLDRALLVELQAHFPVEHRPFAVLGQKLGLTEEQCLERVAGLRQRGILRQLSAVFHPGSLGYRLVSVAIQTDLDRVDALGTLLGRYPGVSYAERKRDPLALWLTLAVPTDAIDWIAGLIQRLTQSHQVLILPVVWLYKASELGEMDRLELAEEPPVAGLSARRAIPPSDQELIRLVQEELPILEMPFAVWAEQAGLPEPELFEWMQRMQRSGCLTRFGATVVERQTQPSGETIAWKVTEEEADAAGERLTASRHVSHCSRRPVFPTWPYPLLTRLHPTSRTDLAGRVAEEAGISEYRKLPKIKEYDRRAVRLFAPELGAWWEQAAGAWSATRVARG
ncbi:MAG: AsnC family transcriptional regulator [Candidatus Omnitrophica bacterium]|nr:AsnC family transcriptional regulator [Candidatus Omnitrophota bacterium]